MVLYLTVRNPVLTTTLLKSVLEKRFALKEVALNKYVRAEDIVGLTKKTFSRLITELIKSKTLHAIKVDQGFLLHPDCASLVAARHFKKVIKQEINAEPTTSTACAKVTTNYVF